MAVIIQHSKWPMDRNEETILHLYHLNNEYNKKKFLN